MNITEQMIDNIIATRFEDVPEDIIERTKDAVSDVVGCALGGAIDTGTPMVVDLVREWGGKEESTVLTYGFKAPAHNVAMANAIMARSFDFGMVDMWCDGIRRAAHISETTVPVALAIAEQKGMSGKDLLTAVVLGEDLTSRMMAAPSTFSLAWDQTGTLNTFGATAVAGKLWGLDKQQWLNAFGIALNHMGGTIQGLADKTHCFKLNQGLSAQRGIFSVRLADKGFIGLKDPFLGPNGYFALYCPDCRAEVLTKDLGKKFWTQISFKPYPQCRGTHAATDCALEIASKNSIDPNDIKEVTVIAPPNSIPALREPFTIGDVPHVDAIFSYQYTVANALLRGYPVPAHFTEESIRDPKIAEMINKVKVSIEDFPDGASWSSAVRVKMDDGREFTEQANVPRGNELVKPLTQQEKREKYLINFGFTKKVNMENAEKALGMIGKLEDVKDVREIIRLLVA